MGKQSSSEQPPEDTVTIDFFRKDDGSDQFTMELTREDFERYRLAAENLGVELESFLVDIAEAQLREEATQWFIPNVDEDGNISIQDATPFQLPAPSEIAGEGKN